MFERKKRERQRFEKDTTLGTLTDSLQQVILCISSIWKGAYFRKVFGSPQIRHWCLIIIQLIMAGRRTMVGWFRFGPGCLKPKKSSTLTFYVSVNNPVPLCGANARRQTWNAASFTNVERRLTSLPDWTSSTILEHVTKIGNRRRCDPPR